MHTRFSSGAISFLLLLSIMPVSSFAKDFKASLAEMPIYAEDHQNGILIDLLKAIEIKTKHKFDINVYPFARSLRNLILGDADLHIPYIKKTNHNDNKAAYDLSTETLFHVNFVLYTNKNTPIEKNKLTEYIIETDHAHTQYFDFEISPSACIECSLKKLNIGRIDGFIFGDHASDPYIKRHDLKNIHRELYEVFEVKAVLPKGSRQGDLDKVLSEGISALKASGEYQKIIGPLNHPYSDWQPGSRPRE